MDATEVKKNWGKVESLIKPTDMPLTALERVEIRHAARTPEQVEAIKQRWQEREDNMALSSAIGIEQGKQMTFDEANEMRGNPHYAEDVQFRVNCQSAVVANELRRRGWDVEAFGNTKTANTTPLALSKMPEAAWLDADGNIPKPIRLKQAISSDVYIDARGSIRTKYKMKSTADFLKEIEEATAEGGRYHISWVWKGKKNAHIVTAERLSDGKLRVYDPQNGKVMAIRLKDIDAAIGFDILRVDNLRPNVDVIRGTVKKAGSTKATPLMDDAQKAFWGSKERTKKTVMGSDDDLGSLMRKINDTTGKERINLYRSIIKNKSLHPVANRKNIWCAISEKADDYDNLIKAADKAVVHGYSVFILSNSGNGRSADCIFTKGNFIGRYDVKTISGKNSAGNRMEESIGQTNRVLLNMNTTYNARRLAANIRKYFIDNKDALEVKIFKGKREISVSRSQALRSDFFNSFCHEYSKRK